MNKEEGRVALLPHGPAYRGCFVSRTNLHKMEPGRILEKTRGASSALPQVEAEQNPCWGPFSLQLGAWVARKGAPGTMELAQHTRRCAVRMCCMTYNFFGLQVWLGELLRGLAARNSCPTGRNQGGIQGQTGKWEIGTGVLFRAKAPTQVTLGSRIESDDYFLAWIRAPGIYNFVVRITDLTLFLTLRPYQQVSEHCFVIGNLPNDMWSAHTHTGTPPYIVLRSVVGHQKQ